MDFYEGSLRIAHDAQGAAKLDRLIAQKEKERIAALTTMASTNNPFSSQNAVTASNKFGGGALSAQ